jgi:hypothetical protein
MTKGCFGADKNILVAWQPRNRGRTRRQPNWGEQDKIILFCPCRVVRWCAVEEKEGSIPAAVFSEEKPISLTTS